MNNPLRQYFRRPALYITLPSKGEYYPEGAIEMPDNGELPVYPMTAIDEITSKTPDALFNGSAVVDIIKSCIPAIKEPWHMPNVDIDTILVAIRAATNGSELDLKSTCPACENEGSYGVDLMGILQTIKPVDYDSAIPIGELIIKFKPISYKQVNDLNLSQFEAQREIMTLESITDETVKNSKSGEIMKKLSNMNMSLISMTIESISIPGETVTDAKFISEFLSSCDRNTFEKIRETMISLRANSNIKPQKVKCVNCSHDYEQTITLNVTDFFV
jgi:hypothetical protein